MSDQAKEENEKSIKNVSTKIKTIVRDHKNSIKLKIQETKEKLFNNFLSLYNKYFVHVNTICLNSTNGVNVVLFWNKLSQNHLN